MLRRLALVLLIAATLTACAADPDAPTPSPVPEQIYTIPADLCKRLDLSAFQEVYGDPLPTGVRPYERTGCQQVFFGIEAPDGTHSTGGSVAVSFAEFDSAAQARIAFDRTAPTARATPTSAVDPAFMTGLAFADGVYYDGGRDGVVAHLLVKNLIVSLRPGFHSCGAF